MSEILTNAEACRWLRLDDDHDEIEDAIAALLRLAREGKIRPLRCGKTYKWTRAELERFARDELRPDTEPEAKADDDPASRDL